VGTAVDNVLRIVISAGMHDALNHALMLGRKFNGHDGSFSSGLGVFTLPASAFPVKA
jgi:hypothetical protein